MKFRRLLIPDDGVNVDINPPITVEEESEVKEGLINTTPSDEEVIYVDSEDDIPKAEVPKEEVKPSIEEILAKQSQERTEELKNLGDIITQSNTAPQQQAPMQPQESEEDFQKRYSKLIFENPIKARKEYDNRYLAPAVGQLMNQNFELRKEVLKNSDGSKELFKKYGKEIEDQISSLPANQRNDSKVLNQVLSNVKLNHLDDIIEERAAAIIAEKSPKVPSLPAQQHTSYVSSGGIQTAGGVSAKKRYAVIPKAIREEAERTGANAEVLHQFYKEEGLLNG